MVGVRSTTLRARGLRHRRILFHEGGLGIFALVVAVISFGVLQRLKAAIYLLVPVVAVAGMVLWTLL